VRVSAASDIHTWEPLPGEPAHWYARFERYRSLGAHRTLEAAYRLCAEHEGLTAARPGAAWYAAAQQWRWAERAAAWDAVERERLRTHEEERRFDSRETRLSMIDRVLGAAFDLLVLADLPHLDQVEARKWAPLARLIFRDMLAAQRLELGPPTPTLPTHDDAPPYTADELAAAARLVQTWPAPGSAPEIAAPQSVEVAIPPAIPPPRPPLLVVIGPDAALRLDLAALRKVKRLTGLAFHRLTDATADDLDAYLRRERSKGQPVVYLHLAVHADHAGVQLADGAVDGDWLSERLLGVQVLLLAGCHGDRLGDWLGVVPHVVTLDEAIGHDDAAVLCEHFWTGIGKGDGPAAALDAALAACAPVVGEYVVRHW
jgi:hypothetical protein